MKKEKILLAVGRELDVLVAKEVFGTEVEWDYAPWDINKQLSKQPFYKDEPRTVLGLMAHAVSNTVYEYSADVLSSWLIQERMRELGYRFIISRSHHRPKGLPQWRASFCKYGGKSNRWFDDNECVAICKAALVALYNKGHLEDRFVQQLNIVGREAEV